LKRLGLIAALLAATVAAQADELQQPRTVVSKVDWNEAAKAIAGDPAASPADAFAALNRLLGPRFAGIDKSTVPVLLPVDVAALRKDSEAAAPDVATSDKYFGEFSPSKFFLGGPAGYDITFWIDPKEHDFKFQWTKPVEIELGGAAYVYELDSPNHQEVFPPSKELIEKFPGMQRILRENHVRYAFERFGVPYVVSIQCYDRPPSRRYLACREADQLATRFLNRLQIAGGTPSSIAEPKLDLTRPEMQSEDFTYYGPGDLIENTGWRKMPGRADYNVYAHIRFPMADGPGYVKSQSFMPWGDCYRSGHTGRLGRKDSEYRCKVNGLPLVFNEAAAVNWTYPWRDNFCELRDFPVGQCPGGYGHQGEDIRPANCVLKEANADRCLPYQHSVAAVHDGMIWRSPGYLGVYIAWNSADEHVRARYLHMNPRMMDDDGLLSGRMVSAGEVIGKVATWGDYPKGTSYHIHFNLQVFTKAGWVWVNPYMTLVAAYERQLGARGREIKPGDPAPEVPDKKPVLLPASAVSDASAKTEEVAPVNKKSIKSKRSKHKPHKAKRHKRHVDD